MFLICFHFCILQVETKNSDMGKCTFYLLNPYVKGAKNKTKKLAPNKCRVYCVLIVDRDHMLKMKTEHFCYPEQWDFTRKEKKRKLTGAPDFNRRLQLFAGKIEGRYLAIREEFPDMPFSQIAMKLKSFAKTLELPDDKKIKDFFSYIDMYKESLEGKYSKGSVQKVGTFKNSLREFTTQYPDYKHLTFSMIDHQFYDSFKKYLRTKGASGRQKTRPEGSQTGLLLDTQAKYIETLKSFLKWAEKRNYNRYRIYLEFKQYGDTERKHKAAKQDVISLTLPELVKLYNFDLSKREALERVRDLFCFAVFTGQRWADIVSFDQDDLDGDIWSFRAQKTSKKTEIDLVGFAEPALDILKKYDYQLPKISSQKFNEHLKEIGKMAGIDTPVKISRWVGSKEIIIKKPKYEFMSAHTARKSCVSILLNEYKESIVNVLQITGHSSVDTLQRYMSIDRESRRKSMEENPNAMKTPLRIKRKTG